jgi:hypothetical protein
LCLYLMPGFFFDNCTIQELGIPLHGICHFVTSTRPTRRKSPKKKAHTPHNVVASLRAHG